MSSLEEKKSELERVLGVFQNYIEGSELLDVVYSKSSGMFCLACLRRIPLMTPM